ncbi:MAG: phosphoribosyltransferase [Candidatus Saccharimonadales bacterium]
MRFADRKEAGALLAEKLQKYREHAVVYALPRGGVVLGAEIAKALTLPLDLIISRKIGHPANPEYAICAVTETGPLICNEVERANADAAWLARAEAAERAEARRRRETYLADRQPIPAVKKTAILVDDGVATGLTMLAAIEEVKKQKPKQTVVAVPVLPRDIADDIRSKVDVLVSLDIPTLYLGAVGAYYHDFPQLKDDEVIKLLEHPL